MKEKKYELLENDTIEIVDHVLHRIRALKDFRDVKKGDLGGYVEKESNLSHEGNCWIYDNACIYGNACAYGNAWVYGNAHVFGDACIYGNARVYDDAHVSDAAQVYGDAWIHGNACVFDDAQVSGNACIYDDVHVYDDVQVFGDACVSGNAWIHNNAWVYGNAHISNDANISSRFDYCTISGFGSEARTTTFFKCKDKNIKVNCGCFNGALDEFREKVKEIHGDNKYAKEYLIAADLAELRLAEED